MNELKTLTHTLAEANRELRERQAAIAEASKRRDTLAGDLAGLDAGLEGAELAHAAALAAEQLGEQSDSTATGKTLEEARRALARKAELSQQHRVAAAVVDGLERKYLEAHAKVEAINVEHKAAMVGELVARADEAMSQARDLVDNLVAKGAELQALRGLLAEHGREWDRGGVELHAHLMTPAPSAVQLIQQSIRAELAAI